MAKKRQPWLHRKLKLSQHRHTGKVLSRQHTSQGVLLCLTLAAGLMLVFVTRSAMSTADALTMSGSVNFAGTVSGPPPSVPAVITQPKDGASFDTSSIDVSGTCPAETFVEIYKNGILAGATNCDNGHFGVKIDLVIGLNRLVAKVRDNLDQYGPDSNAVEVSYNPTSPILSTGPAVTQLLVTADAQYFGISAGEPLKLAITVNGGQSPYALSIDWGDKHQDLISRPAEGRFEASHTYKLGQIFYIKIKASDSAGNQAYAETAALIAGPKPHSPSQIASSFPVLAVVWPVYVSTVAVVAAFWLGEKFMLVKIGGGFFKAFKR